MILFEREMLSKGKSYSFCLFWGTPSGTQEVLLALYSEITSGNVGGHVRSWYSNLGMQGKHPSRGSNLAMQGKHPSCYAIILASNQKENNSW